MVKTLILLKETFVKPKTHDKTGDKQSDITDMHDLECEESAEKRRNEKGHGLKILTTIKCLVDYQLL